MPERELERELAFHLEQQTQENIGKGMAPDNARAAAMRGLGGLAQIQEECRDMRRTNQLETMELPAFQELLQQAQRAKLTYESAREALKAHVEAHGC